LALLRPHWNPHSRLRIYQWLLKIGFDYQEFIMLIHNDGVLDLYMEPDLHEHLSQYLLHIPSIRTFVPSKKQFLDRDHCELLKINWFINTL